MKALIFAVSILITLSGCAIAPYGGGAQNQQSAVEFASQQAMEMKVHGNKFMSDALSLEGACGRNSVTSTPAKINKDAALSNRNGGVSFYIIQNGSRSITCDQ